MFTILRQRNFIFLWLAGVISNIGDWMLFIALPVHVFTITGSTLATGATFIIEALPRVLLGSIAGVFVDRWNRKTVLIVADFLRGAAVLLLLVVHTPEQIWIVYLVAVVMAVTAQFANPASAAILPQVVGEDQLMPANSLNSLATNVTRLIGPAVGGGLMALSGFGIVVLLDSLTFVISGIFVLFVRLLTTQDQSAAETQSAQPIRWTQFWHDWLEGLRVVRQHPFITPIFLIVAVAMIADGIFQVLFVVFVRTVLGGDADEYGLVISAQAVGGIIASLFISRISQAVPTGRLVGISAILNGLLLFTIFNIPSFPLALVLFFVAGFPVVGVFVSLTTLLQTTTSDQYRGRIFGAFGTAAALATLIGMGIGSVLGDILGPTPLLNLTALLNIGAGLLTFSLLRPARMAMPIAAEAEKV